MDEALDSTSRYDKEKRKYQSTASRMTSGSNYHHLNRPLTEEARRSIWPAHRGVTAKLQHFRADCQFGNHPYTKGRPGWHIRNIALPHLVQRKANAWEEVVVTKESGRWEASGHHFQVKKFRRALFIEHELVVAVNPTANEVIGFVPLFETFKL